MLRLLSALYKGCKPSADDIVHGETYVSFDHPYYLTPFQKRDLTDIISLLNEAEKNLRDFRPYTEEEFSLNVLQDDAFDPKGLILLRRGMGKKIHQLVGTALAVADPEYVKFQHKQRGFLRWIRVTPRLFSGRLRRSLLQASLQFIASKGMREALVSVPSHNRADMKFYLRNGFSLTRKFSYMERSLDGTPLENELPPGYMWTHFRSGEEAEWVSCINAAFNEHWGKRPTSMNEFKRWTVDPSFDPSGIIGIRKDGSLVGVIYCEIDTEYAAYTGRKRSMLWIIGVITSERGHGLGERLTVQGMNWSNSKDMKIAALFVDSENIPAVSLYRKLRFEVEYEVHHLLRGLEGGI